MILHSSWWRKANGKENAVDPRSHKKKYVYAQAKRATFHRSHWLTCILVSPTPSHQLYLPVSSYGEMPIHATAGGQ